MQAAFAKLGVAVLAVLALSACGGEGDPKLMNLRSSTPGPDEFGILPTKPLEMPKSFSELPAPTPGGTNITDPQPMADAVAALGGNPARLEPGTGVSAADGALLARAGRFGTEAGIRSQLAAEDLQYRRDNDGRLIERLFDVNVYFRAYEPMSLDQLAELERWRKLGLRTPAAPVDGVAQANVTKAP